MNEHDSFGAWLRRARRARDLSREALAELVSCAAPTLAKIEQGTRRPSRELAALLLDALATPPAERERALRLARLPLPPAPDFGDDPPAAPARPPGLPAAASPLVGRAAELGLLRERLADPACRLVTLVGPGGVGKTRLALQAAAELAPRFRDGAAWADLAPLGDPAGLAQAIAEACGCPLRGPEPPEPRLLDWLRPRRMLLALDNLEHLLAGAPTLAAIVRQAPGVTLLATSRERLRLEGEWVVPLDGLAAPGEGREHDLERSEAAQLFLARARQAGAPLAADDAERHAVAAICRALGGLPLAIELAAAWTRSLSCAEIAAELARGPGLLGGRMPGVFARSWALLAGPERRALAALSVFQGGFTRAAAERVAGAGLAEVSALVEKSLLQRRERGGRSRYAMHELTRRYAAERLAELDDPGLPARHAAYYADLLAASLPGLQGGAQAATLDELDAERANIGAAWRWASGRGEGQTMARCAPALMLMHELRGQLREAAALFAGAAARLRAAQGERPPAAARQALGALCAWEAWARGRGGEVRASHALLVEATGLLAGHDDLLAATGALGSLGLILLQRGRYPEARRALERSLALVRPRGLGFYATLHGVFLVNVLLAEGDLAGARAAAERALADAEASGSLRARLLGHCGAALAANLAGEPALAQERARAALALAAAARDPFGLGLALLMLGGAARLRGELEEARYLLAESAEACDMVGDRWNQGRALVQLGAAERAAGDHAAALAAWRAALRVTLAAGVDGVALTAAVALAGLAAAAEPVAAARLLAGLAARPEADAAARSQIAELRANLPPTPDAGEAPAGQPELAELLARHAGLLGQP